jgi:hypothetical protein
MLVERAAIALGALAALVLGAWQWPRLAAWIHQTPPPGSLPQSATMPEFSASGAWLHWLAPSWTAQTPAFLLAATAAAFLTLMVFTAYVVWRED